MSNRVRTHCYFIYVFILYDEIHSKFDVSNEMNFVPLIRLRYARNDFQPTFHFGVSLGCVCSFEINLKLLPDYCNGSSSTGKSNNKSACKKAKQNKYKINNVWLKYGSKNRNERGDNRQTAVKWLKQNSLRIEMAKWKKNERWQAIIYANDAGEKNNKQTNEEIFLWTG